MKAAFIAAGAAGTICGSCIRDNAFALEARALGHEVTLVPAYTPLRLDEESAAERKVFFGAVDVFLQERFPRFRRGRGILGTILGSERVLGWISRLALGTNPASLGPLTLSILRGEDGNQGRSLDELSQYLCRDVRPDVVHLTNALFVGWAKTLRRDLSVPIVCGLQGEDGFLDALGEPWTSRADETIRERAAEVDAFVATSHHSAEAAAARFRIDPRRIHVVHTGIRTADYAVSREPRDPSRPPTIGYFARVAPEKGLHVLADAFLRLRERGHVPGARLAAAGYLGGPNLSYAARVKRRLAVGGAAEQATILGTLDRAAKLQFLRGLDVLSVPTVRPEAKGIFVLEALACGVPVVLPAHGVFPEFIEATGGGLLHEPGNADALALALERVLGLADGGRAMGEAGRRVVLERFTARRMAEETLGIYEGVLKHAHG
jgi:glycosyltransferase involved in cell wall biosynthesis